MELFEAMTEDGHEQVSFWSEPDAGYRGIVAIHDTTLGPALGGTRFWRYETEEDALRDVLRLARAMTYKAAITGLELGGGKSVILRGDAPVDREALFRAHGRAIEALGGRYITAEDVGSTAEDMEVVATQTGHVTGLPGTTGDPSPVTAYGVYRGMMACARERFGSDDLEGRHVVIQGAGHVAYYLARHLVEDGARITVTDIDEKRAARIQREMGAARVDPDAVYDVEGDIFAPCALGAILNDETIPRLNVDVVAGSANNQLAEARHGAALEARGILYAPDYVINAGGLCNVYGELRGWTSEQAHEKAGGVYDTLLAVFSVAEEAGLPPSEAADRLAERRLGDAGEVAGAPR